MNYWPQYTANYSLLADAFLHGQTSVRIEPAPALLALPDPYDPTLNRHLRMHDLSLYRGKYYLYWGPVPAILEMPFVGLLHRPIGDQFLVFAFAFGLVAASAGLLCEIRSRLFPEAPPWTVAIGVLVAGLAVPMPFLLARAAVYEAAIIGGQCFLMTGTYLAFTAFREQRPSAARLFLAGAAWAMAVGCRCSLAVAVIALTLMLGRWLLSGGGDRTENRRPRFVRLAALAAPLCIFAVLLALYNHQRFGSWTDFGTEYQLAGYNARLLGRHLFAISNAWPALYAYGIKPLAVLKHFPFVQAMGDPYPRFIALPPNYISVEPVAGVLWCSPFLCLTLVPLVMACRMSCRPAAGGSGLPTSRLTGMLATAAVLGGAPAFFLLAATMRYMGDFTPCLVILAVIGLWQLPAHWPAARRLALPTILASISIAIGLLLAVIGYQAHFPTFHPGYLGL